MSSIYGPRRKQNQEKEVDLSLYALKAEVLSKSGGRMTGRINMGSKRIVGLDDPVERSDAATAGYVENYVSHLNNVKLEKGGDTMTGDLDMGNHNVVNSGPPVNEMDLVNKQYVDALVKHEHDVKPYDLGRYIVFPHEDGTKVYFSVRAKKNINLANGLQLEIQNNLDDPLENEFENDPDRTRIVKDFNLNNDGTMTLNAALQLNFNPGFPGPWILLMSMKPGDSPPSPNNQIAMRFTHPTQRYSSFISIHWQDRSIAYSISIVRGNTHTENGVIEVDPTKLNHIALEYNDNKVCFWVNGEQIKTMHENLMLGNLWRIEIGVKTLGLLSFYDRDLSKPEIIQHFVDHHVQNFTNDEVLI